MKFVISVLKPIIAILFLIMATVTLLSTLGRMIPFFPTLYWAGEFTRYVNFWTVCLGMAVALYHGSHFSLDLVDDLMPAAGRRAMLIVWQLGMIALEFVLVYYGAKAVLTNYGQSSAALELPMSYVYVAMPIGGMLLFFVTIIGLYNAIFRYDEIYVSRDHQTINHGE